MGIPGPQKINRYGLEFKLRAVRMSEQPGVLIKDVAESLCIHLVMSNVRRHRVNTSRIGLVPLKPDGGRFVAYLERGKPWDS